MFGLMQSHSCHKSDEERAQYRLLYCGTCKAIGSLYGQSSRFFLNNDVVFLAQLLETIAPAQSKMSISSKSAFRNFNCMALPQASEIPRSLRIASAVCVTLAGLKVEDHLADTEGGAAKMAAHIFSNQFLSSLQALVDLGFPSTLLEELTARQSVIERRCTDLDSLSEATAEVSAVVFHHAAIAVGAQSELACALRKIGHAFGKLIYLLDALEDFRSDLRTKQFNAMFASYPIAQSAMQPWLPEHVLNSVTTRIAIEANKVLLELLVVPLSEVEFVDFKNTLLRNLLRRITLVYESWGYWGKKHRLSHKLGVLSTLNVCDSSHESMKESCKPVAAVAALDFKYALSRAKQLTSNSDCHLLLRLSSPLVFAWVFFVAFTAPSYSRLAHSYQEQLQLAFNLIFWGAVAAAMIRIANIGKEKVQFAFAMVGGDSPGGSQDDRVRRDRESSRPFKDAEQEDEVNLVESDSATEPQATPVLRESTDTPESLEPQAAQQQQQQAGEQLFRKAQEQLLLQAQQQLLAQAQQEELNQQRQREQQTTEPKNKSANRWRTGQPNEQTESKDDMRSAPSNEPTGAYGNDAVYDSDDAQYKRRQQSHLKGRFQKSRRLPKSAYPGAAAGCLFCDSCSVCGEDAYYGTTARRSRGECCCLDCDDCCACGLEGGCDMCSASGGECCTSGECCAGGHCCAAEHCCAGADCCSAADCAHCGGGADCCASADCCTAIDCGAASC